MNHRKQPSGATHQIRRPDPRLPSGKFAGVLLVVALSSLLYLPTLSYDFVWDDLTVIRDNADLDVRNPLVLLGRSFALKNLRDVESRNQYYRPLVTMSFWLDKRIWGLKPVGFHLSNLLLNMLNCLLFPLLLWHLFSSVPLALLGGLAFSLHPMHVESVSFTAGRTDILMAMFLFISLLVLLRLRRQPGWLLLLVVLASYLLALLSKETAIVFPVLVVVLLGWRFWHGRNGNRYSLLLGLMVLVTIGYLVLRAGVLKGYVPPWGPVTVSERLMLIVNAFGRYALYAVVPFFHRIIYPGPGQFAVFGWPTVTAVVAASVFGWLLLRFRRGPVAIGIVWYLLFILPVLNWFPPGISYLAERLLYLPVAGLIIALLALSRLRRLPTIPTTVAVLVYLGGMAIDGALRMPVWRNNRTLYETMVREEPESADARYNLGNALRAAGDLNGAIREFRRALALRPNDPETHHNLALALIDSGNVSGAIAHLQEAVRLVPNYAIAHRNLGDAYVRAGAFEQAAGEYRKAIALQPDMAAAHNNLGKVFTNLGLLDSAEVAFRRAITYQPNSALFHCNLGQVLLAQGQLKEAEAAYQEALRLQPDYAPAREGIRAIGAVRQQ